MPNNKKIIIVFSVEGDQSYTETNFYNGLGYFKYNGCLKSFAIGQASIKSEKTREKAIRVKVESYFRKINNNLLNIKEINIFFIGDGEKRKAFQAMHKSMKIAIDFLKKESAYKNEVKIYKELIHDENISFDHKFKEINGLFPSSAKKGTNKHIFENAASNWKWFKNNSLNKEKILEDLKRIKTKHQVIFEKFFEI